MIRALALCALLLSLALPAPASDPAESLRQGCGLLAGGRWEAAAQAFRAAQAADSRCAVALAGEGTALLLAEYDEAASLAFSRALVLSSWA